MTLLFEGFRGVEAAPTNLLTGRVHRPAQCDGHRTSIGGPYAGIDFWKGVPYVSDGGEHVPVARDVNVTLEVDDREHDLGLCADPPTSDCDVIEVDDVIGRRDAGP